MKAANYGCFFIVLSLLNPNRKTAQETTLPAGRHRNLSGRKQRRRFNQEAGNHIQTDLCDCTHSKKQSEIDVIFQNYRNL